ncbi:Protein of unknown function PDDEXK-like [Dillenia turbinata]|uniref:Uncharacterized protein n=1 Tax=Dillenia turbinata TaxID=194707 RepID=A0AAN8VAM4_9MAGN
MKVQPIDPEASIEPVTVRTDSGKPVFKSRLKRLFDRPFSNVLRSSSTEKTNFDGKESGVNEFEPSSVCLAKMVQNFIEENNEKQSATVKCGRNRCNCFNGNSNDSSDDEFDDFGETTSSSSFDASEFLKSLIPCTSVSERNILADASKIVEKNKLCKRKDELRKIVADGLISLDYNASLCKSKWEKSSSFPAGEYEFIDVIVEDERVIIDVDFRSEFEIARSTSNYKAILQSLPFIFVGKSDRLNQIISIISEAAKQSLKKKGMHFPPWRKAEYMKAKWLSPHTRISQNDAPVAVSVDIKDQDSVAGDLELIFGNNLSSPENSVTSETNPSADNSIGDVNKSFGLSAAWQPPAIKPRGSSESGCRIVPGLASLLTEKR